MDELLEWEAFEETLKATLELKGEEALNDDLRNRIILWFTGPTYGYMWPFPKQVNRWYDRIIEEILNEKEHS